MRNSVAAKSDGNSARVTSRHGAFRKFKDSRELFGQLGASNISKEKRNVGGPKFRVGESFRSVLFWSIAERYNAVSAFAEQSPVLGRSI